jgi:hypothetical protein
MSRLVVVVGLKPGTRDAAGELLALGPPFALEDTRFDRHAVYITDREAIFVFEAPGEGRSLDLRAEDPKLVEAATRWREVMDGRPRLAETSFTWERTQVT